MNHIKEQILERTDGGLLVFNYYMPFPFKPKKKFQNPLYEDKRASCYIYKVAKTGVYRMNDFGDPNYSGDCFWFVAAMYGMDVQKDFVHILKKIVRDLSLPIAIPAYSKEPFPARNRKLPYLEQTLSEPKEASMRPYKITEKPYTRSELSFWEQYGTGQNILDRYHVKSLQTFQSENAEGKSYCFTNTSKEPIFGFLRKDYVKVYRPFSQCRFVYGGILPETYVFGMEQLPQRGDILFITGGEKDVLSLASHGFHAICFNSETGNIEESVIEMLARRFRHIFFLYDMDETGIKASTRWCERFSHHKLQRIELPLSGNKQEKDISDYFKLGNSTEDFRKLISDHLEQLYTQTIMLLSSCEINYNNPPDRSKTVISVNDVPLGTYDNLFCITGGEGTGKSNYIAAIISGVLHTEKRDFPIDLLGLDVCPNMRSKAVLHYDTEQSEYQLHKNIRKTLRRASLTSVPDFYHPIFLAALSRKERLQLIKDSIDLYHHRYGGIHLVVIDGIADLIRSANDESESIAIVDELYRLAGIYNTCIICVLHFVPNGIKLRGHIGSELQRKSAAILSIEKDENPALSVVKALKVRDGSPLDVPLMLFGWDREKEMHVYRGEKSPEDKEKRKLTELGQIAKEVFHAQEHLSYNELVERIMQTVDVKDRTAKSYISYMRNNGIIEQQTNNLYNLKL